MSEVNKNIPLPCYNNMAWHWMLKEKMEILRARLLNLADTITDDKERRNGIKGLIKDFCNQTYFPLDRDLKHFMIEYKVIEESDMVRDAFSDNSLHNIEPLI